MFIGLLHIDYHYVYSLCILNFDDSFNFDSREYVDKCRKCSTHRVFQEKIRKRFTE